MLTTLGFENNIFSVCLYFPGDSIVACLCLNVGNGQESLSISSHVNFQNNFTNCRMKCNYFESFLAATFIRFSSSELI